MNKSGKYSVYDEMSIDDLKYEYKKCNKNDVANKEILKKIIKKKEKIQMEVMNDLNMLNKAAQELSEFKSKQKNKKIYENHKNIIKQRGSAEKYWISQKSIDPKYKSEVEKDVGNNKLMERLNSELNFRTENEQNPFDCHFDNYNEYTTSNYFDNNTTYYDPIKLIR